MKRVNNDEDLRVKKVRASENLGVEVANCIVLSELDETSSSESSSKGTVDCVKKDRKMVLDFDLNVDDVEKDDERFDLDLNMPAVGTNEWGIEMISGKREEIISISSDESDDEEVILLDVNDNGLKGKQIEERDFYENLGSLSLGLGAVIVDRDVLGCDSGNGAKRYSRADKGKAKVDEGYSRADKGKAKVDDGWLSLTSESNLEAMMRSVESLEPRNSNPPLRIGTPDSRMLIERRIRESQNRYAMARYRDVAKDHAGKLARSREDLSRETLNQEEKEADKLLGNITGPFSSALKMVRERNLCKHKPFIEWTPSVANGWKTCKRVAPTLLELSLKVLADNAMAIVSLELVPDNLRRRFANLVCNIRGMNAHVLDLLVEGSPIEIRIKDCHWLTEDQFSKTFGNFDMKNLRVLQLDLCGQCTFDYIFGETFCRSSNSLPNLGEISLRGACRLSDKAIKTLVMSTPALWSINLSQCSFLTETGVNFIANSLGSILRELYIDDCQGIDAMLIVPALLKFKHLEVLSVAGLQTVCDQFVNEIVNVCGRNLKELNLADCLKLTNDSLKVIGSTCADLRALNISKLEKVTDVGIEYLANGCRSLQALKLHSNRFSDEAIAAFLEASGKSITELSLNNVSKVGHNTAFSLAKCSRNLSSLDLSWCRRITNEALGLVVDSCLSLRLVKLFGCTQITEVFLNGHSNSLVQIVGMSNTPLLDNMNILEEVEFLLRYSPLSSLPSESSQQVSDASASNP